MDNGTCSLFDKVAKKMGWLEMGGLDVAEEKLINKIGKSRHVGTSGGPNYGREEDADKENLLFQSKDYRNQAVRDSSDDDFDQFLEAKATPKNKTYFQKPSTKKESIAVVSSDSEGTFETFLKRVKTPNVKSKMITKSESEDSLKNFIVDDSSSDDDFEPRSFSRVPKKSHPRTPSAQPSFRRPLSQCDSPVFVSDSEDDNDDIVIKSTWRTRHAKPQPSINSKKTSTTLNNHENSSLFVASASSPLSIFPSKTSNLLGSELNYNISKRTLSAPPRLDDSGSSEEEFTSLLDRLKKKNKLPGSGTSSPAPTTEINKKPIVSYTPVNVVTSSTLLNQTPPNFNTTKPTILRPMVSQTEPRHGPIRRVPLCKTPGCFLETLSNPGTTHGRNFKQNKEELTSRLYKLYNISVFDSKLPENMSVTWNKKMRKTAGYCITGQERGGGKRYARIELSEKVCDSADRLRDTLIHEMCHAATWLINGVRDGHGNFWKLYARKSTVVHPELPMVTRCHSYDIKYKFQYQCTRCQNIIGRHSKSLDTERFVCALCTGRLVLLNPSKPRTPTPFANFVKENYGAVRQELVGQSHAEVMRKLSADFALKTKLSQS